MGEIDITGDERRLHIQAYHMWEAKLAGRPFPALRDLGVDALAYFRDRSALIRFDGDDYENAVLAHVGDEILEDCGGDVAKGAPLGAAPAGGILWHVGVHYMEVLSNRAPIGFEAEYERPGNILRRYRGILLPLSDDGENIHFILSVMSWRDDPIDGSLDAGAFAPAPEMPDWDLAGAPAAEDAPAADDDEPGDEDAGDDGETLAALMAAMNKGRQDAQVARARRRVAASGRSRADLYATLTDAYARALDGFAQPDGGRAALAKYELKAQARAPFTPWLKLVFGRNYDKTRIAEYALALKHAQRAEVEPDELAGFLNATPGGIKGCVRAERAAATGAPRRATSDPVASLARSAAIARAVPLDLGGADFALVIARAGSVPGTADLLTPLTPEDPSILRLLRQAARKISGD